MSERSTLVSLGVGLATLLVVGGAVTALAERWIEFSLFVGVPAGLLAGAAATLLAARALAGRGRSRWYSVLAGVATFGYAVVLLAAVRYAVAATRSTLTVAVVLGLGVVAAAVVVGWLVLTGESSERL